MSEIVKFERRPTYVDPMIHRFWGKPLAEDPRLLQVFRELKWIKVIKTRTRVKFLARPRINNFAEPVYLPTGEVNLPTTYDDEIRMGLLDRSRQTAFFSDYLHDDDDTDLELATILTLVDLEMTGAIKRAVDKSGRVSFVATPRFNAFDRLIDALQKSGSIEYVKAALSRYRQDCRHDGNDCYSN